MLAEIRQYIAPAAGALGITVGAYTWAESRFEALTNEIKESEIRVLAIIASNNLEYTRLLHELENGVEDEVRGSRDFVLDKIVELNYRLGRMTATRERAEE